MKREVALEKIEDMLFRLIDTGNIHIVEINGVKTVGLSTKVEDHIMTFMEEVIGMSPPLNEQNCHFMDNDLKQDLKLFKYLHSWEK